MAGGAGAAKCSHVGSLGTKKVAMTEATQITIGAEASCSDGVCGEVTRVVVDPIAQAVTHLVVEPKHRQGLGRLVPLNLVSGTEHEVRQACSQAGFSEL